MAKAVKNKKWSKDQLLEDYMEYVLVKGEIPSNVFQFTHAVSRTETEFYEHFSGIEVLSGYFWTKVLNNTIKLCKKDKAWSSYSATEKVLALEFTFIEILNQNRSFALLTTPQHKNTIEQLKILGSMRKDLMPLIRSIIAEGFKSEEIIERPVLDKKYDELIWSQFMFLLLFWRNDTSSKFESTDAAIEKSVNLMFNLLGKGPLDSIIDFGKFVLTHGMKL